MENSSAALANKLRQEGQKNLEFLESILAEDWDKQVYTDGPGWNVREVISHISATEQDIPNLIQGIVGGGAGVNEDFNIDRFNAGRVNKLGIRDKAELLAEFAERRERTVEMTQAFSDEDLEKLGRHPFLGESQVVEMIKLMYLHINLHIRDIKAVLRDSG